MEMAALFILILINGFFAMSEIALVSARRARLQLLVDAGDSSARLAIGLGEDPTRFLSTVQIGITCVALLSGIVGQATLAPPLAEVLRTWGLQDTAAPYVATAMVVAAVTYFSIVVGELVPKRFAQLHAESVARFVARPIHWLSVASRPLVWILTRSTQALLKLLRIEEHRRIQVSEQEIHAVLQEGSAAGVIEEQEHRMVRNLFRLDDRLVTTLMTPRSDVVSIDADARPADILKALESSPHSHYPLIRRDIDEIVGVVSARAMLLEVLRGSSAKLEELCTPALVVPETIDGMQVLDTFRTSPSAMAFVVDEYGSILGLVTPHDVLEAITGQLTVSPEDQLAVLRSDGSWLLDGRISMAELTDRLGIHLSGPYLDEAGRFQTLAGLVLARLGHVPRPTEAVEWRGWKFEVVDMDEHRIDKVLATSTMPDPS